MDLGRGANPHGYMIEEIWQELAKARYLLWEDQSTKRSWELQSLKYVFICMLCLLCALDFLGPFVASKYIFFLINVLREACEAALREKHLLDSTDTEGFLDETNKKNSEELEALDAFFRRAAEEDTPAEVRNCVMTFHFGCLSPPIKWVLYLFC